MSTSGELDLDLRRPGSPAARQRRAPVRERGRPRDRGRRRRGRRGRRPSSAARTCGAAGRACWDGWQPGSAGDGRVRVPWSEVAEVKSHVTSEEARPRLRARPGRRPAASVDRAHPGSRQVRTLSSLRGRKIVTESGRELGRCHDVRAELGASQAPGHRRRARAARVAWSTSVSGPRRAPHRDAFGTPTSSPGRTSSVSRPTGSSCATPPWASKQRRRAAASPELKVRDP